MKDLMQGPGQVSIGPKWTSRLLWWIVIISVVYVVGCFGIILISFFMKSDTIAFYGFLGLLLFIPFSFIASALGIIVYGIASVILRTSFVKVYRLGGSSSQVVYGTEAVRNGIGAILVGYLFLSMIASAAQAMVCNNNSNHIICAVLWFLQLPFEFFGKIYSHK